MKLRRALSPLVICALALFFWAPGVTFADGSARDTAQAFIAALTARDAAAAIELLAEDAVLEMPYPLAPGENAYGTRNMWGDPLRVYVNGVVERNSKIGFNKTVWYSSGEEAVFLECEGDLVRSRDGKRYRNNYLILFKTSDGKITLWREYFNPVIAAHTFGIPLTSLPNSLPQ